MKAQDYDEYIGAGGNDSVRVFTSSDYQALHWDHKASGDKTIKGDGLDYHRLTSSRFLAQSSVGYELRNIEELAEKRGDFETWIDEQASLPKSYMLLKTDEIQNAVNQWYLSRGADSSEIDTRANWVDFSYAWWEVNMRNDDLLRQRIALALSEILVISIESDLSTYGRGLASYYDIFIEHAFGNYRDILRAVSLHPAMGFYLSHLNNPKTIVAENIHPDENYAREIMQLFTIGLYELNLDGSRKKDMQGNDIPTYGQDEIKEFAKIFTGLGVSAVMPNMYVDDPYFGLGIYLSDMRYPMKMYEEWHEPGEKYLLNGQIVPNGQTGIEDIEDALDNLFNHPNVGPFIGRLLIQRMVKSNPTPAYIERVASAFNDNGSGVRGDILAVVKAILLDPEARSCDAMVHPQNGMLRAPMIRYAQFIRSVEKEQFYNRYWNVAYGFWQSTGQVPLSSPTVFNFYLPDYQPLGPIADQGLVGPEFQIHNTRTSIGYINEVNSWAVWRSLMNSWEEDDPGTRLILDDYLDLARDPEALVNHLDLLYTYGTLSDRTRNIIKSAISPMIYNEYRESRAELALYLMMISPDYVILK
jgi:uncharacterized protein (DUF1800 family)